MRQNSLKLAISVMGIALALSAYVRADKLQIQEKMSKEVKIQLNDVTITEALDKIGQKAGVKFVLSDEAVWRLPYGEATRLSVSLNGPLADSMTEMLNAFFMRYAVDDEKVTIYPRPELEHILGRATAKQLELLRDLYTKPIRTYIIGDVQSTINNAIGKEVIILPISEHKDLDASLDSLRGENSRYIVQRNFIYPRERGGSSIEVKEYRPKTENGPNDIGKEFRLPTPLTPAQLFDEAASSQKMWYLSGIDFANQVPEVRFILIGEYRQAKLDQIIDVSYKQKKAGEIIQTLANWTEMQLVIQSGNTNFLNEPVSIEMQNTKLGQALMNILTAVGARVEYNLSADAIIVSGPREEQKQDTDGGGGRTGSGGTPQAASKGYAGKISVPMEGGKYFFEFMLRENDLTEQLKKIREEKMIEILGQAAKSEETKAVEKP